MADTMCISELLLIFHWFDDNQDAETLIANIKKFVAVANKRRRFIRGVGKDLCGSPNASFDAMRGAMAAMAATPEPARSGVECD